MGQMGHRKSLQLLGLLSSILLMLAGCGGNSGDGLGSTSSTNRLALQITIAERVVGDGQLRAVSGQTRQVTRGEAGFITSLAVSIRGQNGAFLLTQSFALTAEDQETVTIPKPNDPPLVVPVGGNSQISIAVSAFNASNAEVFRSNPPAVVAVRATQDIQVVPLTLTPVNPPMADPQTVTTPEDTAVAIGLTGSDVETAPANFTWTVVGMPTHGTLTGTAPNLTYTPVANYNGPDSVTYTITDRGDPDNCGAPGPDCAAPRTSEPATVSITVRPVNDPPRADDKTVPPTLEDTAVAIGLTGSDVETAPANFTWTVGTPAHGTLTGTAPNLTYTPVANYNGPDSFTYTITDRGDPDNCGTPSASCAASKTSAVATVSITVLPVNDAPVAADDVYTLYAGTTLTVGAPGVLGNDFDVDSTMITAGLVSSTSQGIVTLHADGSFTYTPTDPSYVGLDSFTYKATDDGMPPLDSAVVTVTLNVLATNAHPVAVNDVYDVTQDTTLTVISPGLFCNRLGVLCNDLERSGADLTATVVSGPVHAASFTLHADGSFTYTPTAGYTGPDTFTYTVSNGTTVSNVAMVTISILAADATPVAKNDETRTVGGGTLTLPAPGVLGNDSGTTLTATLVTAPLHATTNFKLQADGLVMYEPAGNYNGPDSFMYRASDGSNTSNVAMMTIQVVRVIVASDLDGDPLTFSATNLPPGLSINLTTGLISGTIAFTAVVDSPAQDFAVTVSDGTLSANASFTWTATNKPFTLFGTDANGGHLLTIDPATGTGTIVGPLGVEGEPLGVVPALAIDPTTGIMYAATGGGSLNLYRVDPATGATTFVGSTGLGFAEVGDMAFRADGTLYAAVNIVGDGGTGAEHLAIMDTTTGEARVIGPFGRCTPSACTIEGMEAIAFDAAGTLWGAVSERGASGTPGLYKIDPTTGTATFFVPILDATGVPASGGVVSLQVCHGTLFGGTARAIPATGTDGGRLITIEPTTGLLTFVGSVSATAGRSLGALACQ